MNIKTLFNFLLLPFNFKLWSCLLILTFNHSVLTIAQNLVPNPSFEDTTGIGCPNGITQSMLPTGWSSYSLTPDYFNLCSPTNGHNSIPNNGWGYQFASSGNAYCGEWAMQTIQQNVREYIGRQLSIPLVVGQKYYVNLKVSLAEISNCGLNKMGVLLSTVSYDDVVNPVDIVNYSHIYSSVIITDTANWTRISGSFIADSAYQYIIIGNFFDDINTDTIITGPPKFFGYGAYYFIDDIYLGTDSLSGTTMHDLQNEINIYPNPVKNKLFVKINNHKEFTYSIFNMLGVRLKIGTGTPISLVEFTSGSYFLQIQIDKTIITKKITLIK